MLPLFALSAIAQAPVPLPSKEILTPQGVERVLASAGYVVRLTNSNGTLGTVSRDGATVDYDLSLPGFPKDDGTQSSPEGIELSVEIPIGEDPPFRKLGFMRSVAGDHFYMDVSPHLGRTATLWTEAGFGQEWSPKSLRATFDRFWREGAAYARRHGGRFVAAPEQDWSNVRFPDSLVLDQGDGTSFVRAMDSWGYKRTGLIEKPSHWSSQDYIVGGQTINVSRLGYGVSHSGELFVLSFPLGLSAETQADEWIRAQERRKNNLIYQVDYNGNVVAMWTVNLREGVKLGDLRRDVEEFAAAVAALPKTLPATP